MKGLIIWAYSECRSMMGLYREMIRQADFPIRIAPYHHHTFKGYHTVRTATGFCADEFADVPMIPVGENRKIGLEILDANRGFRHLFAVYQGAPNFRYLMSEVKRRGEKYGIISESPCNMSVGLKSYLKDKIYFKYILPKKVASVVDGAEFFINLSGSATKAARMAGWEGSKIVPWGYYSPAIPNSSACARIQNKEFLILVTGIMSWHRAPDVVVHALKLLKDWGVEYRAIMTQNGPMKGELQQMASQWSLPISFPGLLPMSELIRLYQTCSIYVAAGRREPWGMRLNDAIQCGAPVAVSRGMGGSKLVDDYGCGVTFENEDFVELAHKLWRLATDGDFYKAKADSAMDAAARIRPSVKAKELLAILSRHWDVE